MSTPEQQLAQQVTDHMYAGDMATQHLGMKIVRVAPGEAEIHMPVQPWMLNGHRTCHGGVIFTLAESTFAFACNSRNQVTVASAAQIDFVAPGREGDVLQARAKESWRGGRAGVYDISVHRQDGTLVALFRGKSHQLAQTVLPSDAA